jgi:phage shock protein C
MDEEEIKMTKNVKKFYRASEKDSKIAGVCAGVADYLEIDPTIVRIIWAILALSGVGIIAYVLFWIIAPRK